MSTMKRLCDVRSRPALLEAVSILLVQFPFGFLVVVLFKRLQMPFIGCLTWYLTRCAVGKEGAGRKPTKRLPRITTLRMLRSPCRKEQGNYKCRSCWTYFSVLLSRRLRSGFPSGLFSCYAAVHHFLRLLPNISVHVLQIFIGVERNWTLVDSPFIGHSYSNSFHDYLAPRKMEYSRTSRQDIFFLTLLKVASTLLGHQQPR